MARTRRILRFIAAAALVGSASLGQPAQADIVIGVIGAMTGDNAPAGAQLQAGAEAAVAMLNSSGGVLGEKLALSIIDDGCNGRRAVTVANKVVSDNISFVVGPDCSAVVVPASSILADNGTIEIALGASDVITEQGFDGLFRLNGRNTKQSKLMAEFIGKHHSGKRVALVADRSAYAIGLMAALRGALAEQRTVSVVLDQSIDAGTKDFGPLISSIKNAGVDVVTYIGFPPEAGLLMSQTAAAGVRVAFVSANTIGTHQTWDIGGKAISGAAFTCRTQIELLTTAQDAVASLKAKGKGADGLTLYAYASVQLLAGALIRAKSAHPDAVADELHGGSIATVMGDLSFDERGDVIQPIWRICRWDEGTYAYYPGE
jgi:branched-chain amino acid transport system substrate-binding protein